MRILGRTVGSAAAVLAGVVWLAACSSNQADSSPLPGGNAARGAQTITAMGCGACHHIPGITGADGKVGPPLDDIAERGMIAGEIPNSPENMMRWVLDPQAIEPGTAMPNLHLDDQEARDIVAYLYTLH